MWVFNSHDELIIFSSKHGSEITGKAYMLKKVIEFIDSIDTHIFLCYPWFFLYECYCVLRGLQNEWGYCKADQSVRRKDNGL